MFEGLFYHGNKSTILLFYSIFRTTPEVSSKLYFVEICQVSEKLWLFNYKRADFWLPNFGFKRSLLNLLKTKHTIHISSPASQIYDFVWYCSKLQTKNVSRKITDDNQHFPRLTKTLHCIKLCQGSSKSAEC